MPDETKPRRLRAIFKNAVVWGLTWGAIGTVVSAIFRLNDKISLPFALLDGLGMGIRIGIVGGLVGAAFAAFISVRYRGKQLSEISAAKFGVGAGIFSGLFVPAWMQTMRLLSGDGLLQLQYVTNDIVMATLFGGITAAGTMLMAKRDAEKNPTTVQELLEQMESQSLGAGDTPQYNTTQRERSTQY